MKENLKVFGLWVVVGILIVLYCAVLLGLMCLGYWFICIGTGLEFNLFIPLGITFFILGALYSTFLTRKIYEVSQREE